MSSRIKKVAVVGAGTMGIGIAQVIATAGYQVMLYDMNQSILETAVEKIKQHLEKGIAYGKLSEADKDRALKNIRTSQNLVDLTADLVIEAIIEDLEIKADLFSKLETINHQEAIFATNTSSLSITKIAANLKNPERLVGLHFFNPAHIMKLVEVVSGGKTVAMVTQKITTFAESLGKVPVQARDSPGFIVNRVARHFYLESLKLLEEQVADAETIDSLMENQGFKMGPFKLMDLIGVDVNYAVSKSLYESFQYEPRFRPNRIQQQKVDAGQLGKKTGEGFFSYGL